MYYKELAQISLTVKNILTSSQYNLFMRKAMEKKLRLEQSKAVSLVLAPVIYSRHFLADSPK